MRERLTILVTVETSTDEHSLRSQVGKGSESDCLFRQWDSRSASPQEWTSDSETGVKTEKAGGEDECRDDVAGLLVKERRSLNILPVKKEATLSASEVPVEVVGSGEEDLRCRSLWYCLWRDLKRDKTTAE